MMKAKPQSAGGLKRVMIPYVNGLPLYWLRELSGQMAEVVEKYLNGYSMTPAEVNIIRSYVLHWAEAPGFVTPDGGSVPKSGLLAPLDNDHCTVEDIRKVAEVLLDIGIDPF